MDTWLLGLALRPYRLRARRFSPLREEREGGMRIVLGGLGLLLGWFVVLCFWLGGWGGRWIDRLVER